VLEAIVVDQYGNSISNERVVFRTNGQSSIPEPEHILHGVARDSDGPFDRFTNDHTKHTAGAFAFLKLGDQLDIRYDFLLNIGQIEKPVSYVTGHLIGTDLVFGRVIPPPAVKVGEVYPAPFTAAVRGSLGLPADSIVGLLLDVDNGGVLDGYYAVRNEITTFVRASDVPAVHAARVRAGDAFFGNFKVALGGKQASQALFGLDPKITNARPAPLIVDQSSRSTSGLDITYDLRQPGSYESEIIEIALLKDGRPEYFVRGSALSGIGSAHFPRGIHLMPGSQYALQVISNGGHTTEVRSDPFRLVVERVLFKEVQQKVEGVVDVDVLNQESCEGPFSITFKLNEQAAITLETAAFGPSSGTPLNRNVYPPGKHTVPLDYADFGEGLFDFTLTAESTVTGRIEQKQGQIEVVVQRSEVPPVGHAIANDVDLFDGSLTLSRSDLSVPGRGVVLEFTRSYSSSNTSEAFLGVGWSHNYDVKLVESSCGFITAKGIRFFAHANGYRPGRGYHATLLPAPGGFDLFTKDGTRHHFRKYPFDDPSTWHLEFIQDTNGNVTRLGYSPNSPSPEPELAVVEDPASRTLRFSYMWVVDKRVIRRIEGPDQYLVEFFYDTRGRLIRVDRGRNGSKKSEAYEYLTPAPPLVDPSTCDPNDIQCVTTGVPGYAGQADFLDRGAITSVTDAGGNATHYMYEKAKIFGGHSVDGGSFDNNFIVHVDHPEGGATLYAYSSRAVRTGTLQTTVTDPRGNPTTHVLNQYGSPLAITSPIGTRSMTWSSDGIQVTSETDENGVILNRTYDLDGNILTEQVEAHRPVIRTYAPLAGGTIKNRIATSTDRNGHATRYQYDSRGNMTRVNHPDSSTEEHVYAANGDRIRSRDRNGNWTSFTYDKFGNLELIVDPVGNIARTTWNGRGSRLETTDARGNTTRFAYDDFDRLIRVVDPSASSRFYSYDQRDNKLTETDEEGRLTEWEYDAEGHVVRTINAGGSARIYSYDLRGNLVVERDWKGNVTTHEYDANNRRVRTNEPEGRVTDFAYDPVGNLIRDTRQLGRVTKHRYDDFDRRIETEDALGEKTSFVFDDEGNLTKQVDRLGRVTDLEYDALDRLRFKREPLGRTTEMRYDANGNEIETLDANGNTVQKQYDALNRVVAQIDGEGNRTATEYDAVGNVVRTIDPRGNVTMFSYDALNREVQRIDALGNAFEKDYDRVGNLVIERWPNGNVIARTFDDLNRLVELHDGLGRSATSEYDANGNLVREIDGRGNATTHVYDGLNQRVESNLPEGRKLVTAYDLLGNAIREVDANGNVRVFEYDVLDRLHREIDPLSEVMVNEYDAVGNLTRVTNRRGHSTVSRYDELNRVIEVEDAAGQILRTRYDAFGNIVEKIDRRGIVTRHKYDRNHRLIETRRDGQRIVSNGYDESGNLLFVTDANGEINGFEYDRLDRLFQENRPLASITRYTYNAVGDRITERDPEGRFLVRTFDLRRRKTSETINATDATNGTETTGFEYDAKGNQTAVIKPEGNSWTRQYDAADRLVLIRDPLNGETTYTYDRNGNRTSQTDPRASTTLFRYDAVDRLVEIEYPDQAKQQHSYDENGNLTEEITPNGIVKTLAYDDLDREISQTFSVPATSVGDDIEVIATTYDANNNVVRVVEHYHNATIPDRVTTAAYDVFDREIQRTDAFGKTLRYAYDANGNRIQLTDPDGKATTYTYDVLNRLQSVLNSAGVTTYTYERSGRVTEIRYPNNTVARRFYDDAGRMSVIDNTINSAPASRFEYSYDRNGNRIEQTETNGGSPETTTYGYDSLDRLTSVSYDDGVAGPGTIVTYGYDASYNRATERAVDNATGNVVKDLDYDYDSRNQLTQITDLRGSSDNATYVYDASGNQIQKVKAGITTDFVFDARDHLRTVTVGASTVSQFLYDYSGLRVEKAGDRDVERYTYDGQSVLLQHDAVGSTIAKFDYGAQRLVSLDHAADGRSFYLFDALGSVVGLTAIDGSVESRYQYDAWGALRRESGGSWNRFGFTGHERDTETGLVYFKGRYYDTDTARFLSQDAEVGTPDVAPSLHLYLYAFANPTIYVDPTGRFPWISDIVEGLRGQVDASKKSLDYLNIEQRRALGTGKGVLLSTAAAFQGIGNAALSATAEGLNLVDLALDAQVTNAAEIAQQIGADALTPNLINSQLVRDSQHRIQETRESAAQLVATAKDFAQRDDLGAALVDAGKSVVQSGKDFTKSTLVEGDLNSTGTVAGVLFETAVGGAISRGVGSVDELADISQKQRILTNIAESRSARRSSKFAGHLRRERRERLVQHLTEHLTESANARDKSGFKDYLARERVGEVGGVFRGTTSEFVSSGPVPTSTDPAVATVFATQKQGIVQIIKKQDLEDVVILRPQLPPQVELEAVLRLSQSEVTRRASATISAREAREILRDFGVYISSRLSTPRDVSQELSRIRRLTPEEARQFIDRVTGSK